MPDKDTTAAINILNASDCEDDDDYSDEDDSDSDEDDGINIESHAHTENNIQAPYLRTHKDVQDYVKEEKYIISLSQVLKLAPNSCMVLGCNAPVDRSIHKSGAALVIKFSCPNGHDIDWTSSPTHRDKSGNSIFAINLLLANSAGNNINKIEKMFR